MNLLPMNLQLFAADTGAGGGNGDPADPPATSAQTQGTTAVQIDYGKIQQMLDGTLAAKEDTALKAFFKQQGLSQEEVTQAIEAFKQQRAANQPDVSALQQQAAQAQALAEKAQLENKATLEAIKLGIPAETIPYMLKMADLSKAKGADGKISDELIKNEIEAVLKAVPGLKPTAAPAGFTQIGAPGSNQQSQVTVPQTQTPTKRWNRFN